VIDIVKRAINAPIDQYKTLPKKDKRKFMVNPRYCEKYGKRKNQVKQIIKKLQKMNEVMSMYDMELTDEENIKILNNHNIKISLRTLKNYKKELNIFKYKKRYN
jgi:DNA-directed RNA polymerase specialized sigma54-like protein